MADREYVKLGAVVYHDFEVDASFTINVVSCSECGAFLQAHSKKLHDAFHDSMLSGASLRDAILRRAT